MTLSRNADSSAVTSVSITRMPQGRAWTFLADQIARYWNTPERLVTATMTIIPVSRPRVLKSTPSIAASWVRMPAKIIRPAASSATMARFTRSLMTTA